MTTPAIREAMSLFTSIDSPADPTELQWFDISHCVTDKTDAGTVSQLMAYRPPFNKSIIVWRGKTASHEVYDVILIVGGDDPEEGVVVTAWKGPYGKRPRTIPSMVYVVDGDVVRYGAVNEDDPLEEADAKFMLAMVGAWYRSLSQGTQACNPYVKQTFTNRRKIASGKTPTYDWRTVVIGAKKAKSESKGGTHASPREHDRRGHLRRLRTGKNVWVSPCKVGSAALGAVFHDYEVRAA